MRILKFVAALAMCFWANGALADLSKPPTGAVLLVVDGDINTTNVGAELQLDRDMLHQINWTEIETYTPYTDGTHVFAGPALASVIEAAGGKGEVIEAVALNDYTVDINVAMAVENGAILAMNQDGKPMRIREKGPIWIVFPQDQAGAEASNFSREMVWQLARLTIH